MFKYKFFILVVFSFVILSFFETKTSHAFTPVTDDFSNLENWFVFPEDKVDTWFVADGWLVGW